MTRILADMLGREVTVPVSPRRIVSLCPSITETLFALGLDDEVAGLTRYCIYPADKIAAKTDIGGTKKLRLDDIDALNPDLIIAEKEENRREDVERLERQYPVYVMDVVDVPSAFEMIGRLGVLCGRAAQAEAMNQDIQARWKALPVLETSPRVAYLIWRKPWMAAGSGTFIDAVLQRLGLGNVFAGTDRYPQFSAGDLQRKNPTHVLLSSEPFPFADKHIEEIAGILPEAKIQLVDGEMFSWYGARMLPAAAYLAGIVEPFRQ